MALQSHNETRPGAAVVYRISAILDLLVRAFGDEELKTFCLDSFRPVYEKFSTGMEKGHMARLLVDYVDRQCDLPRLLDLVRQANPGQYARCEATLAADESSHPLKASLEAALTLLEDPTAREAIIAFRTDLQAACEQIAIVNAYKRLHDHFQELETSYNPLKEDRKHVTADPAAWDRMALQAPEVEGDIEKLVDEAAQSPAIAGEGLWRQDLTSACDELRRAIEQCEEGLLASAARRLERALAREPSRINTRLVAAVSALRLDDLIAAMTRLHRRRAEPDPGAAAVREIADELAALTDLNDRLGTLVGLHNRWQELDDELRRIQANLDRDPGELTLSWPDVKAVAGMICRDATAEWAVALQKAGADLEDVLAQKAPFPKIQGRFVRYRSQAGRRFHQVDDELLTLCNQLQKIGEELNRLLRVMG